MLKKVLTILFILITQATLYTCAAQEGKGAKATGAANPKQSQETRKDQTPLRLLSLISEARLAPAEFRADALIRLAASKSIADRKLKVELLEEAFESAADAQFPVKKKSFTAINADTREGYLENALELNLDATSLRCRVVDDLLPLEKKRAREFFSRIQIKQHLGGGSSCEDVLVFDVTAYYKTLGKIAGNAFESQEIEGGGRSLFVGQRLSEIVSAVELGPAADLLVGLNLSANELQYLVHLYSIKLGQVASGYRAFDASEGLYSVTEAVHNLISHCEKRSVSSGELVKAYREYLINNLTQEACGDMSEQEMKSPYIVQKANALIFGQNPIASEDVRLRRGGASLEETPFWTSAKSKLALNAIRRLRFNQNGEELPNAARLTSEWDGDFNRVINILADWKADDEKSVEDYLHQKAVIYGSLLEAAPTLKRRGEVLEGFLIFLSDFSLDRISRAEWYWHLTPILQQTRTSEGKSKAGMLGTVSKFRIPVLSLYAALTAEGL